MIAFCVMIILTLPVLLGVIVLVQPTPPPPAWGVEAASLGVEREDILVGQGVYRASCAVCHGPSGEGLPLLGKPVRNSAYVQQASDEELFSLLADGRKPSDPLNTTGALMPARGAQGLDDDALWSVITYLRAIQDPGAPVASVERWDLRDQAAGRGDGAGAGTSVAVKLTDHPGYELFVASCAACHGEGGQGMENFGLPLTTSGFVRGKSDKELITFIKMGRPMWDENNSTGLDMPPKGGNPAITDDDLQLIVDYIRAVQKEALGS